MRICTSDVIIIDENFLKIGLAIADIILLLDCIFINRDLNLHFQGQLVQDLILTACRITIILVKFG